eukprot:m.386117 g.386117  ORF g.386117 m.386117 type:complete len:58 (-) comp143857_c0_seq1:3-176(-)
MNCKDGLCADVSERVKNCSSILKIQDGIQSTTPTYDNVQITSWSMCIALMHKGGLLS